MDDVQRGMHAAHDDFQFRFSGQCAFNQSQARNARHGKIGDDDVYIGGFKQLIGLISRVRLCHDLHDGLRVDQTHITFTHDGMVIYQQNFDH